jgi:hypothetical protein
MVAAFWPFSITTEKLQAQTEDPPTLDDIIQGLEQSERKFFESKSVLIRYERTQAKDVTPSSYSGGPLLAEWTFAYLGNNWYNKRRFTQPKKNEKVNVSGKPKTQVIRDRLVLEWNEDSSHANLGSVDKENTIPNLYAGLIYTRNLSLDAPKYIAKAIGADITEIRKIRSNMDYTALPFLPEFLRENKSKYKVLAAREEIDGRPCWIVEWPGMDRFWVDPSRGYAVPRRIYCWGPGKPRRFEFRNSAYREVKAGLWLPFALTEYIYASIHAEREAIWGKITAQVEYHVHSLEFDHVSQDLFDVRLPPGTRVTDMVRDFQYTASGEKDADPFDEAISAAKQLRHKPLLRGWILVGAALVAVSGLIGWWMRSRRRVGGSEKKP